MSRLDVDVFRVSDIAVELGQPSTDFERWIVWAVSAFSDHGYKGYEWATYIDLEILWAIGQIAGSNVREQRILDAVDLQIDKLIYAKYGLIQEIHGMNPSWPEELPAEVRLALLRATLVRHIDDPRKLAKLPQIIAEENIRLESLEVSFNDLVKEAKESAGAINFLTSRHASARLLEKYWNLLSKLS